MEPTDDSNLGRGRDVVLVIRKPLFRDEGDEGGGEAESEPDAELRDVEDAHRDALKKIVPFNMASCFCRRGILWTFVPSFYITDQVTINHQEDTG